jgi:hypothetical protein
MIKGMMTMASWGYGGQGFGDFFRVLDEFGVFRYGIPFLLLFALIFGVLKRLDLFKNNHAVEGIIALSVSLMALQVPMVSDFFSEIFPRFGVGIVIILVLLILTGFFVPYETSWVSYVYFGISAIVVLIILINTSGILGWEGGNWFYENWMFIMVLVVGIILVAIIMSSGSSNSSDPKSLFTEMLKKAK